MKYINTYLLEDGKLEDSLQDFTSALNLSGKLYVGFADPSPESIRKVLQIDEATSIRMLRKYFQLKNNLAADPYNIEYFIIDCSPGAGFSTINIMVATDSSLFIVKLSNADLLGTSQMITALYEQLKSRTLVLANLIPEDFIQNEEKATEIQSLIETLFAKDIGNKVVEFLGWIPQDSTLLNYEFEQALRTLRRQESSRIIFTLNQPDHMFSTKIIELLPILFDEKKPKERVDKDRKELAKRLKVFVVGEPLAGKTALYHALSSGRVPEMLQSTAGIDRYSLWRKKSGDILYGVNWWDFAGQYAYRDTHKLFLTDDALYILTLNLRESIAKTHAQYWLESIREKAPNAKILPILTHYDEVGDKVLGLASSENWQKLQEFISIFHTLEPIKVSNTKGTNIDKVELTIRKIMNEVSGVPISTFHLELEEYLQDLEEHIFLSLDDLLKELDLKFGAKPSYSKDTILDILTIFSVQGLLLLVELPTSPIMVIFDVDRVTKVVSLIIDHAKTLKGYVQEIDILDISMDFFPREKRRDAAKIIADLMVHYDLALVIPEQSSTGRTISSWFIPHASEVITKKDAEEFVPQIFTQALAEIGKSVASFNFNLSTYDETISARLLGHLLHYIPYSNLNRIWREYSDKNNEVIALVAVLYADQQPIMYFCTEKISDGTIRLNLLVADASLEKGLFASIIFALGKLGISFESLETIFITSELIEDKIENLLDRLNKLSNIPTDHLETISQAIKIYSSTPSSTIMTTVTALEGLFVDLYTEKIGPPHPQMKFWEIIKGLYEINILPRTVKIWADTVRLHRNNCAHNLNPIDSNDALIVLEEILYILEWYNQYIG